MSLDDARREARKRIGEIAKGGDPLGDRRREKAAAQAAEADSLESIAREYFRRERNKIRTINRRTDDFERLVFPTLGKTPITAITRRDVVRLLDKIEDERGASMADKMLMGLSRLFNWHAARSDDFRSPIVRGMGRINPKERARSRTLTDNEIRAIWAATEERRPFNALVRFLLLSAARRTEASAMTGDEIDGDGVWTIPTHRAKGKADVVLPLSDAARTVLAAIPRLGPFPFSRDGRRPFLSNLA